MSARGIKHLVVLGDVGFLWPGHNWGIDLGKLSRQLITRGWVLGELSEALSRSQQA